MDLKWYVVKTKPLSEDKALRNLIMQGIEVYLPKIKKTLWRRRKKIELLKPLFPGYLFAKFSIESHFRKVSYTIGVSKIVSFNGFPVPLEDEEIEFMKARESNGFISIGEESFKRGERVRVVKGPFSGFEGLFERELEDGERVEILLKFLSHKAKIAIEKDFIEKLD
jgi:transcriptional antiterminator RfaH